MRIFAIAAMVLMALTSAQAQTADAPELSPDWFANPPFEYRPAAAVHVGAVAPADIPAQLKPILIDRGFGGVTITPYEAKRGDAGTTRDPAIQRVIKAAKEIMASAPPQEAAPDVQQPPVIGSIPDYLSEEYFARYRAMLAYLKAQGRTAVLYDELGYPSGAAGGNKIDPANYRKLLVKTESAAATALHSYRVPSGVLLAAVAMNESTKKRIDLTSKIRGVVLDWKAPSAGWKVMFFTVVTATPQGGAEDYYAVVDYMDPKAVQQFIDVTYEAYARHVGDYFGNTVTKTFFDDVGIYSAERTWAIGLDRRFERNASRSPNLYYPALWENIGPSTFAARVAFFGARADMLADGFPRLITDWAAKHGLQASGHTPGQYELQPTDMNGDPFKFYRAQPIPMIDVIFTYGFGRSGYKLTTSAADSLDKPVVAAEQFTTCGTPAGYKRAMDSFVRGVNFLITCQASNVGGPAQFAEWAGRTSMLLRGGRRVADVAIVYPIASLQAYYRFEATDNQTGPVGRYAPATADYLSVGDMLTGDLHRDFTFLHPDDLKSDHLKVAHGEFLLDNKVNWQTYKVLILPGGAVLSADVLRKIKSFYDAGGKVIGTTELPSQSAEFGRSAEIRSLVKSMFDRGGTVRRNRQGGEAVFLAHPSPDTIRATLNEMKIAPDVSFDHDPAPRNGGGELAYIHKVKDGKDIYFIANSSDDSVVTSLKLRGVHRCEFRDPYTGTVRAAASTVAADVTTLPLKLAADQSVFVVADSETNP